MKFKVRKDAQPPKKRRMAVLSSEGTFPSSSTSEQPLVGSDNSDDFSDLAGTPEEEAKREEEEIAAEEAEIEAATAPPVEDLSRRIQGGPRRLSRPKPSLPAYSEPRPSTVGEKITASKMKAYGVDGATPKSRRFTKTSPGAVVTATEPVHDFGEPPIDEFADFCEFEMSGKFYEWLTAPGAVTTAPAPKKKLVIAKSIPKPAEYIQPAKTPVQDESNYLELKGYKLPASSGFTLKDFQYLNCEPSHKRAAIILTEILGFEPVKEPSYRDEFGKRQYPRTWHPADESSEVENYVKTLLNIRKPPKKESVLRAAFEEYLNQISDYLEEE